jgi:transposase InsO family protein
MVEEEKGMTGFAVPSRKPEWQETTEADVESSSTPQFKLAGTEPAVVAGVREVDSQVFSVHSYQPVVWEETVAATAVVEPEFNAEFDRIETEHMNRLQEIIGAGQPERPQGRRGGTARRQPRRVIEQRIRQRAVDYYWWRLEHGGTLDDCARDLNLLPRTLRQWKYDSAPDRIDIVPRGRPQARSQPRQRNEVIDFLKQEGPSVGVPTLREHFPGMARAELEDLLRRFRRVLHVRYHDTVRVLHWQVPGRVWAMDFAEPSELGADWSLPPIEGKYPYLVAVRDLASGFQLSWMPLMDPRAETAIEVLRMLFALHGAPLILKMDNGAAFIAEGMKSFLEDAGVIPLYSPPYWPRYNGSIEAGIGSLKWRTDQQATRAGHPGIWTSDDVEAARQQANSAYWKGLALPTPADAWAGRTNISRQEWLRFQLEVERQRLEARIEEKIGWEEKLDHRGASALDRKALQRALGEHGYLLFTRRRIPLRIRGEKVTEIV